MNTRGASLLPAIGVWLLASLLCAPTPIRAAQAPFFRTGVLPILTKAGCNSGACHGAATGQGGFKLSLLGYDPVEDHQRITRELGGRRLDLEVPAQSLFLLKPTRKLDHEGGRRIPRNSESYQKLLQWIEAGAAYGPPELQVQALELEPADSLIPTTNRTFQLRISALLSDGSRNDVTDLALFTSNDDAVAEVGKTGQVRTRGSGLTSIMVRYSGQVTAARIAVPFGTTEIDETTFASKNFIDEGILAELKRLRVPPSPLSGDGEFMRRVWLDLIGRLPTSLEARDFLSIPSSIARRQRLIDELLARDEFVDFWTLKLADLLLIGGKRGDEAGTRVYHRWLREQVARNLPFDKIVRTLLTATGSCSTVGPANFYALANDPRDLAEHVGRMFLGVQIGCARCHAHPNDRWTREDYHRFAAYFARVGRNGDLIEPTDRGEVEDPKTGEPLSPQPLGAAAPPTEGSLDRRTALTRWLTAPENPLFARALVNRVWKQLLGRGLVEPVDDLRPTNPPTHPALLEALAAEFVRSGFDLRHLIRTIVSSRTYQLTSRALPGNRPDRRLYSHGYLKVLPAQVVVDAIAQVTGVPDEFEGYPKGTHAVQLTGAQTPSYPLEVLGRCARQLPCDNPVRTGGGVAAALHLINGSTINDKLNHGIVDELLTRRLPNPALIEEFYLRTLTRRPEPAELAEWEAPLDHGAERTEAAQDLLWALLNSREFTFNH